MTGAAGAAASPARVTHGLALALLVATACLATLLAPRPARAAGLPPAYGAIVVEPQRSGERVEFDLTPALDRARRDGRRVYLFLGAHDCHYCRRYESFLQRNATALVPEFAGYQVVDLRSALNVNGTRLAFRIGERSWSYVEFQQWLGDERNRLVYPTVWLLDTRPRPLMQMPTGTGTFETVEEQVEVLKLVQ